MAHLPLEVVEEIFKYLISLEDRKSASLVCIQWYKAFLHPYFRTLEVVRFHSESQLLLFRKSHKLHRCYIHFEMSDIEFTEVSLPFFRNYGKTMKSLSLHRCFIREYIFVKAMTSCSSLEALTIQDCKELLMTGLLLNDEEDRMKLRQGWLQLRYLSFAYNRYLSDAILIKMLSLCPQVNTLILTGCQISYHSGMFHRFYPNGLVIPSESVTTFQTLLRYIAGNSKKIKTLSLSHTLLDGNSLYNLSRTQHLGLRELQLNSCMQISNQGLIQMCTTPNLKALTELDVGLCPRITDTSLIILCSTLRQLRKFSVQACRAITDMGVANIMYMDKLEVLNLSDCELIQGAGILKGLCHKVNYTIREINLAYLVNMSDTALVGMVAGMPNLRHLDLASCYNAVTDVSLQAVFRHSKWLRSFNISMCDRVTDCGLTGLGVSEKPIQPTVEQLLRLPLGGRYERAIIDEAKINKELVELCESELVNAKKSEFNLSSLRGLQKVNLSNCNRVTDLSLKYAFQLTELKALDLSQCQRISADGLYHLAKKCPAIEDLNLDMCQNMDDSGVAIITRDFKRLRCLVLGSDKVTDEIAEIFPKSGLTHIDVRHCRHVTGLGVGHLMEEISTLKTFLYPETVIDFTEVAPPPPPPAPAKRWWRCS